MLKALSSSSARESERKHVSQAVEKTNYLLALGLDSLPSCALSSLQYKYFSIADLV